MNKIKFPTNRELAWATLEVLKNHRRPLTVHEIAVEVVKLLGLDPKILDIMRKNGKGPELPYRIGWILTNLKNIGAVENTERGYWGLTRLGQLYRDHGDIRDKLILQYGPEIVFGDKRGRNSPKNPNRDKWKNPNLLDHLQEMDPDLFEDVCHIFLSRSGIREATVTAKASDGSFEGTGLIRIATISFRVFFRCRKSAKAISKDEVMNFRGTMIGCAENGLYITTSTFSDSASKEAVRDGAPPIGLIGGVELCNQLRKLHLEK